MGSWKYEIVHDYNATRLIKEFREENLKLKNSKGMDDDETDCILYAEKDDHTISLGRVLLVKMSDAMIDYYYKYNKPDDLPKYWAKYIYEENKNNKTFQFNEEEISDAFLKSIVLQRKLMSVPALELQNYFKKITENLSDDYRKDEKFSREQWDPTLKSDQYLFAKPELAINYFVKKSDSLKNRLTKFRKQLEHIKSFKIVGKEFKIKTIEDIIKGIDGNIKSIENFKKWMIGSRDDIKLNVAYFCGIYNGIVEFIAGFIDIGLLAINIVISDLLGGETNLEFLEIREAIEETLSKILQDPGKVFNDIIEAVKNYKYSRYDDPKLNQYEIQYNEGEDTILAVDIIVTIVTIIKALAKLAKLLPKFTKWIDEVLAKNGKGARKVGNALMKLRKVAYGESELSKIAIMYRKTLGKAKLHNGNIAIVEYLDDAGKAKIKEFTTLTEPEWKALGYKKKPHAERIMTDWILDNNIPKNKITKIFSELEPCQFDGHQCKDLLDNHFPDAIKEFSYDYPGNIGDNLKTVRDASLKERLNDMKKIIK